MSYISPLCLDAHQVETVAEPGQAEEGQVPVFACTTVCFGARDEDRQWFKESHESAGYPANRRQNCSAKTPDYDLQHKGWLLVSVWGLGVPCSL